MHELGSYDGDDDHDDEDNGVHTYDINVIEIFSHMILTFV